MLNSSVPATARISNRVAQFTLWVLPLLALANVALLVVALDGRTIGDAIVHPELLVWAALLTFVPWLTNAVRLILWARFFALGLHPIQVLRVITGTIVANAVTPSTTGGPALKWALLVSEGVPSQKANSLISYQVAEDGGALIPLVAVALIVAGSGIDWDISTNSGQTAIDFLVVSTILGAIMVMLFASAKNGLLGSKVSKLTAGALGKVRQYWVALIADWRKMLETGKLVALTTSSLAAVQWIARFSIATLVIGAAGGAVQPILYWVLQWMVQSLGSMVPTPGGAGGAEAAFLFFFAPFLDSTELLPVMTIWRLLFFYLPLVAAAGLFFVLRVRRSEETEGGS